VCPTTLDPLYQDRCIRPCEYVGFSFADSEPELQLMKERGANAVGTGSMWFPTEDADAPYGVGIQDPGTLVAHPRLGQTVRAEGELVGVAVTTPTYTSGESGCTVSVYRVEGEGVDFGKLGDPVAARAFTGISDNAWTRLDFGAQPPGRYYIELSQPTGNRIGWWAGSGNPYAGGMAYLSRRPVERFDFEARLYYADGSEGQTGQPTGDHAALELSRGLYGALEDLGMRTSYSVGNWNNGFFPYYPDWFEERFPDIAMLDQNGQPLLAGMFEKKYPWPAIDHPVIVNGTQRYIRAVVGQLREEKPILSWVMGGEALYATYAFKGRWTDYQENARAHFREWMKLKYPTVRALNAAWGTQLAGLDEAEPPESPGQDQRTLDWFDFRFHAMAERFQWHFDATKSADPSRFVLTCNHGTLFDGMSYAEMGADLDLYAGVSDGFEMGQIMMDDDADLYNMIYMQSVNTLHKPLSPVRLAYKFTNPRARGGGTSYTPQAARRYFWESVGTGAWHLGFIQWRGSLPDGEWGVQGTPAEKAIGELLGEWHGMEGQFDNMWPVRPRVALYLAHPTWALAGFQPSWHRLHEAFVHNQIPKAILTDAQVQQREAGQYDWIVSFDNRYVSPESVEALRRYVQDGGTLICAGPHGRLGEEPGEAADLLIGRSAARQREQTLGKGNIIALGAEEDPVGAAVELLSPPEPPGEQPTPRVGATRPRVGATRPLHVRATSAKPILRDAVEDITGVHDFPQDLSGHTSVGQTITAKHAFVHSVAVCTPTYTKDATSQRLRIEVLLDGPGGERVGQLEVPPAELTDNSWHEVVLDREAPAGTRYYVRLIPPEGLPAQLIGVWCHSGDVYPGGQLYLDDEPMPGDMRVVVRYRETVPAREGIEAFTLTDGVNVIGILSNVSDGEIEVEAAPAPWLFPDARAEYVLRDVRAGTDLHAGGPAAVAKVSVPAHDAVVVLWERSVGRREAASLVRRVADSVAALKRSGHATSFLVAMSDRASRYLREGRLAQAHAAAWRCTQQVGLRVSIDGHPASRDPAKAAGQLRLEAEVVDLNGRPVRGASVRAVLVPLYGFECALREEGAGHYAATLKADELPARYDYAERQYKGYRGFVEADVFAEADGRRGQEEVSALIE
jgi:hypothetical protein